MIQLLTLKLYDYLYIIYIYILSSILAIAIGIRHDFSAEHFAEMFLYDLTQQ